MISSTVKPQAMSTASGQLTSMKYVPPYRRYHNGCPSLQSKPIGSVTKSYAEPQATSSTPIPGNGSDKPWRSPISQTSSSSTGSRFKEYYAGPAFLASPPASALPIPKWFRKPINEGKELLEDIMLKTAAKQSPGSSDESPTLRRSGMDANQFLLQDDRPLKFHLPADRAEKGTNREGNAMPTSVDEIGDRYMPIA